MNKAREHFLMAKDLIPAAVLIPLLLKEAGARHELSLATKNGPFTLSKATEILLTVRSDSVEHHKGQISFPGGTVESHDGSLAEAALRETQEEIGLARSEVEIVAELPDIPTVATRFRVRPFVGLVRGSPVLSPNPAEIGQIILVPFHHLLDPANSEMETYEREGLSYQMKTYYFGTHRIWGATGLMIQTLIEKFITPT